MWPINIPYKNIRKLCDFWKFKVPRDILNSLADFPHFRDFLFNSGHYFDIFCPCLWCKLDSNFVFWDHHFNKCVKSVSNFELYLSSVRRLFDEREVKFNKFSWLFSRPGPIFCGFLHDSIFECSNYKERIEIQLILIQSFEILVDIINRKKRKK